MESEVLWDLVNENLERCELLSSSHAPPFAHLAVIGARSDNVVVERVPVHISAIAHHVNFH